MSNYIPLEKKGYEFIKTIDLFIPHIEIGLNVLVRIEQQISFFAEVILKLIDSKCSSIANISEITGVEEEIINDVVGGMSNADLIYIRSGTLILAPQGSEAIKTLKETKIEKDEVNKIFINAITGDIVELNNPFKRPNLGNPCLDKKIKINEEFLNEHFIAFNEYYQKRRDELEISDYSGIAKSEIYQILSVEYEKLCYSFKKVFIYKDLKDNDLIFECENDKDNIYANTLADQLHFSTGARNFLKNKFEMEKYKKSLTSLDVDRNKNSQQLIDFINSENYKKGISAEPFDNVYFTKRYLFQNELNAILNSLKNIKPIEVCISSFNCMDILNDTVLSSLQNAINNMNTKLTVIIEKNDKQKNGMKNKVLQLTKKEKMIDWIERDSIKNNLILLFPYCLIEMNYILTKIGNDYLVKEISNITFDKQEIDKAFDFVKSEALLS
ncbi:MULTISPECIES: hypothetical protein [unclassified Paenibacillus]